MHKFRHFTIRIRPTAVICYAWTATINIIFVFWKFGNYSAVINFSHRSHKSHRFRPIFKLSRYRQYISTDFSPTSWRISQMLNVGPYYCGRNLLFMFTKHLL